VTDKDSDLADDPAHPLPSVDVFDAVLTVGGGGASLGMVIAAPLEASTRSLARLNEKLKFYLDSFWSEFGHREWGTPKEGKMKIYVRIHPGSSQEVFERLESFSAEARSRGVDVVTTRIEPSERIGTGP
jgi:hypothetical protein